MIFQRLHINAHSKAIKNLVCHTGSGQLLFFLIETPPAGDAGSVILGDELNGRFHAVSEQFEAPATPAMSTENIDEGVKKNMFSVPWHQNNNPIGANFHDDSVSLDTLVAEKN